MSGGSFDYLYLKLEDVLPSLDKEDFENYDELELEPWPKMFIALKEYEDTEHILAAMETISSGKGLFKSLQNVFKEVEWHHSGDSSRKDVIKAIKKWNKKYKKNITKTT